MVKINSKIKYPTISIVMPTYNSDGMLDKCLRSIRMQQYPQENIEIIIGDGGSTDDTLLIAKNYGVKIVAIKDKDKQGAEYNRAVAAQSASNEVLAVIDYDNVLPHILWLKNMVQPLLDDKRIIGVETLYYHYNRKDPLLGRYFSLFGANDVLPFYLGKADRLAHYYKNPKEYGVFARADILEKKEYFIVDFDIVSIPTLGSNGFLIRRDILFKNAQTDPDHYYHIDINVDLIRKGFNRYAFIKDTLWHKTNERGFWDYLKRRKLFMEKYYVEQFETRRFSSYEPKDFWGLIWFIFISLTVIKPFLDALRGYRKIHDIAWFLHPFMCFSIVVIYTWVLLKNKLYSYTHIYD